MSARCRFYRVNVVAIRECLEGKRPELRTAIENAIAKRGSLSADGRQTLMQLVGRMLDEHDYACHRCGEIYGAFTNHVPSAPLSKKYFAWPMLDDFATAAETWPLSEASKEVLRRLPGGRTPYYEPIGEKDRGTTITAFISPEEVEVLLEEFGYGEFWDDEEELEEALQNCATNPDEMYEFINEYFLHALELAELGGEDCIVLVICR